MNTEKLNNAIALKKRIDHLQEHFSTVNALPLNQIDYIKLVTKTNGFSDRILISEFNPIHFDLFLTMYLANVKTEIEKLQKEFENL